MPDDGAVPTDDAAPESAGPPGGSGPSGADAGPDDDSREHGWRSWPAWARRTVVLAVLVAVVLGASGVALLSTVRASLPTTGGDLTVAGLRGAVDVRRDSAGVPHIVADDPHDLFFAQGYVTAQDRFFQMDVRRHYTAGRLSELFGEATLESDKTVRTMGWRDVAQAELALLDPATVLALRAYADGVNAWLRGRSSSELSLEYVLLATRGVDVAPEPWQPVDSLAWFKAVAWDLRADVDRETERGLLSVRHSDADIAELYPPYPYAEHPPVVQGGGVVDGVFEPDARSSGSREPNRAAPPWAARTPHARATDGQSRATRAALVEARHRAGAADALGSLEPLLGRGDGIGSNSWVVSGDLSASGQPLLANDPHLDATLPGPWTQVSLTCRTVDASCPYDVSGFVFAGVPGVVVGRNADVAWGLTSLQADTTDLFLERIRDQSYDYDGRSVPLRSRDEEIVVHGRDAPFVFTVRSTRHGPLLSDVSAELSTVGANSAPELDPDSRRGDGYAVALSWTALTPGRSMDAVLALDTASGWDEVREAASLLDAPAQGIVFAGGPESDDPAEAAGHIGYQAAGRIPVRGPANDGQVVSPGWDPETSWLADPVPFDALPNVEDPERGWIVAANQAPVDPDYPYYLGSDWDYGYRSHRIGERLADIADAGPAGVGSMTRLQLDTRNELAPALTPYLLDILPTTSYYSEGPELLAEWDGLDTADSAGAAYFNAVVRQVLQLTYADDMRESIAPSGGSRWWAVLTDQLERPDSRWWDDVETPEIETRDDILGTSLRAATNDLVRLQARDPARWTWGHQHQLRLRTTGIGEVDSGLADLLLDPGTWEVAGGSSVVDATAWDAAADDFEVTSAPSMRMVVDLARPDAGRWVNLTGVSGHSASDHRTDQTDVWTRGETLPWPVTRGAVAADTDELLRLLPGRA